MLCDISVWYVRLDRSIAWHVIVYHIIPCNNNNKKNHNDVNSKTSNNNNTTSNTMY